MMGSLQVEQGRLFYNFPLDAHVPADRPQNSMPRAGNCVSDACHCDVLRARSRFALRLRPICADRRGPLPAA